MTSDIAVELTSDVADTIVHENQSAMITVQVTVFGSLSGDTLLVFRYGDGGLQSVDRLINRTSGTQRLKIPTAGQLTCTRSEIQVTVTTTDPLVELRGNRMFSIHIGKIKFYQFCTLN
jgi:hypothetical protein